MKDYNESTIHNLKFLNKYVDHNRFKKWNLLGMFLLLYSLIPGW